MVDESANALADRELDDAPSRVAPLSELDELEIADGYPEIRGWDLRDAGGRSIGYVYDLLIDVEAMRVRYLDVLLDAEYARSDDDQRVLIPIERVGLNGATEEIRLDGIDASDVHALVPYARRGVTREREAGVTPTAAFADVAPPAPAPVVETELRREPQFDDERLFTRDRAVAEMPPTLADVAPLGAAAIAGMAAIAGSVSDVTTSDAATDDVTTRDAPPPREATTPREVTLGDVAVRKVVETERVRERVPVVREEIEVERRALRPGEEVRAGDTSGDEIRIPIMVEEVVVEKRMVAKEVLIIRKRRVTEERIVETDLRREDVQIEDPLGRVRQIGPSGGPEGRA